MTKTLNRRTFLAATAALPCTMHLLPDVHKTPPDEQLPPPAGDLADEDEVLGAISEMVENICCNLRDIAASKDFQCALGYDNIHISHRTDCDRATMCYQSRVLILYPWPLRTQTQLLCVGPTISLKTIVETGWLLRPRLCHHWGISVWRAQLQRLVAEAMLDPIWFIDGLGKEVIAEALTRAAIQEAARIGSVV